MILYNNLGGYASVRRICIVCSEVLILGCGHFRHICSQPIQLHHQLDMHTNMLRKLPIGKKANVWCICGDSKSVDVYHARTQCCSAVEPNNLLVVWCEATPYICYAA